MAQSYSCLKPIQTSSNINISSDNNIPGTWQTVLGNTKIVLELLGGDEESEDIINWEAMISLKTVRCKFLTDDLSAQPTDDLSSQATDDLSSQAMDDLSSQETKDLSSQPGAIILDSGSIYLVPSITGNETTDEGDKTDIEVIEVIIEDDPSEETEEDIDSDVNTFEETKEELDAEEKIFQDMETEEDTKENTIEESDTKEDSEEKTPEERNLDETLRQPVGMGYVTYPGVGTFKLHAESRHWNRARDVCESEQAHLVVVDTQDKVDVLLDLFSRQPHIPSRAILRNQVYVGISDQLLEGEFYTVFGECYFYVHLVHGRHEGVGRERFQPWDQSIWAPGEPDEQYPGEDCVTFHVSGKIRDVPCLYSLPFVCQLDLWSVIEGGRFN
uniref:C-type lectin domain-containing protein n=1 Tax=Timema tahoe TaxID=61484 RepID=A0A7R9IAJ9_9NEOP|nr:unnamed protein product [Timema tahoe]